MIITELKSIWILSDQLRLWNTIDILWDLCELGYDS